MIIDGKRGGNAEKTPENMSMLDSSGVSHKIHFYIVGML